MANFIHLDTAVESEAASQLDLISVFLAWLVLEASGFGFGLAWPGLAQAVACGSLLLPFWAST